MDRKSSNVDSYTRRKADVRVHFCVKCVSGNSCKVCDRTFEKNVTTSFHQLNRDIITSFTVNHSREMIADIGCPTSVIGRKDKDHFIRNLSKYQQEKLELLDVDEKFKFGPSGPYNCFTKLRFPIETFSNPFIAEVAIAEADIPMLLGNNILKPLEAEIKLFSSGNGFLKLNDSKLNMKETPGGHYTVKVADLGNLCDNSI